MIHDLIVSEIERCGGTRVLAERLLIHGRKPFITWLVHKFCTRDGGGGVTETLKDFAELTGLSVSVVHHSYYCASAQTVVGKQREDGYLALRTVLEVCYPYPALWQELLRYAYRAVRRFAVELLVEQNVPSAEICDRLNVSQSTVYKIRKACITRYIQQKGDDPDDTKHYQ